ncbi:MAG: adenylyltransferase/cytidyltransferase family protein [Candidatus Curtissbacteria bacterium]|nr:adenylyltransferase/cytidyltransferase family protein [Candidatus Curtissbacteria bacterium]
MKKTVGEVKGFVCGSFDLLHAGHIHLLRECKKYCDELIVGLHVDPSYQKPYKNKPIETILERQLKLWGCRYVDRVIVYEKENELPFLAQIFNIDIRFLGSDYKNGDKKITDMGIPIIYIDSLDIHTSGLRERVKEA